MVNDKPNYYMVIPYYIAHDDDIEPNARLLYGEIASLSNKEGYCWATNEYFAKAFNKDVSTIKRWLRSLKEKDYIKIEVKWDSESHSRIIERKIYIGSKITRGVKNEPLYEEEGVKNEPMGGSFLSKEGVKNEPENNKDNIKKNNKENENADAFSLEASPLKNKPIREVSGAELEKAIADASRMGIKIYNNNGLYEFPVCFIKEKTMENKAEPIQTYDYNF